MKQFEVGLELRILLEFEFLRVTRLVNLKHNVSAVRVHKNEMCEYTVYYIRVCTFYKTGMTYVVCLNVKIVFNLININLV